MSNRRAVLVLALALSGCAFVVQGTSQDVTFESKPSGASFTVGGQTSTTPATLTLPKDDYTVVFSMPGYVPQTLELKRQVSLYFYGSLLMGGIATSIDLATGAWKEFQTTSLQATLQPEPGTMEEIQIRITSEPSGAEILLGDVFYGRTPADLKLEWKLEERTKDVSFRCPGYYPQTLVLSREETKLLAVLKPEPAVVRVHITSSPPGVDVRLDGRAVGSTPLYVDVDWLPKAAPKTIEGKREGFRPTKRELRGPEDQELFLELKESVDELSLPLRILPAGASLEVDGVSVGEARDQVSLPWSLSLQKHVLKVSFPGYAPQVREVRRSDATRPLEVRLAPLLPKIP